MYGCDGRQGLCVTRCGCVRVCAVLSGRLCLTAFPNLCWPLESPWTLAMLAQGERTRLCVYAVVHL